jgi:phenylalanyl-tRNA synthetase beta chain
MKVSLNWINEFVDLKGITPDEIVSRFSLTTAEIEGYEVKGAGVSGVVVAEIKTCERVANSDKLWKLGVDDGSGKVLQVMCAAANCRVGLRTAYARVGSQIGDFKIGVAKLAGHESNGMCLGADELGLSSVHKDIIDLGSAGEIGQDIKSVLPIEDVIFEIDNKSITNRPDLWGHYGIARELSVIFNKPFKPYSSHKLLDKFQHLPKVPVVIENKKDCLSYGAMKIDNITVKDAPMFMQIRLFYCGINAHGFLVDLTNYIMLEIGQPCHAFDARKIGKISVGNVNGGTFVTLKDQEVNITPEMLFIKSDGVPVALAGVIGGKNSGIEDDTKDCVFEFATFDAVCIRKTAAAIGTRTDASIRYEKSLDTSLNLMACARTFEFIEKFDSGAKVVCGFNWVSSEKLPKEPIVVSVRKDYLERFCGMSFDYKLVERNLTALGFEPKFSAEEIVCVVPYWRATKDVSCSADLIEEIVRTIGYDNIKPAAPRVSLSPRERLPHAKLCARLKDLLCDKYAFDEVHTYIWNDTKLNKQLGIDTPSHLRVVNSCIKDDDAIRSAMIPSMIGVVARNKKLGEASVFEIGRVCCGIDAEGNAIESQVLGLCVSSKTESGDTLYKKIADIMRDVFDLCGFKVKFDLGGMRKDNYLHPKNNAAIKIGGKLVGGIGMVHPSVASAIDSKINLAAAAIHLDWLGGLDERREDGVKISKYQKNTLDFTFVTDKIYGEVEKCFDQFKHPLYMGYVLKDVFGEGMISYTLTFTVGSFERTLTSADIEDVHKAIIAHGKKSKIELKC